MGTALAAYLAGETVAPRLATEVHSDDARAALPGALNVSDLLLDRHDLLARVWALTDCPHPPSSRRPATTRLRALGWCPGGRPCLVLWLAESLAQGLRRSLDSAGPTE